MRRIFLDHQAGTPLAPEVAEAMRPFFTEQFGNPSSLHGLGLTAREAVATAREQVASLINAASPDEILFTSGGTEAANLAVKGTAFAHERRGRHIVVSATEHPAVLNSVAFLESRGFASTRVPVDREGFVSPDAVRAALRDDTILVCVQHANHDIGTLEPVREIGNVAGERGIPLFVDATASGGWLPVDARAMGADLLSLSPHRFHGPKGVGVLYRSRRARLTPLHHGGDQESGLRAGTENVPGIVGAGAAAALAQRELPERVKRIRALQERLWAGLQREIPHLRLNGPVPGPRRSPVNLNVSLEFTEGEGLALMCDLQGLLIASGPSCVEKSKKIPPVLAAIGLPEPLAQASILLSPGRDNTPAEMDEAVRILAAAVARLREMSPAWDEFQRGARPSLTTRAPG
jgi:cysteine desulfurase